MKMTSNEIKLLDCTFRDGGYYNSWDFPSDVAAEYLQAMDAAGVDIVELGFRFPNNVGFKGPFAFTSDEFISSLRIPDGLELAVMLNGSDLLAPCGLQAVLTQLFPNAASDSPVTYVRLACHYAEIEKIMPAVSWLADKGYKVGLNVMQVAERTQDELHHVARLAQMAPVEVLYIADSTGSLTPDETKKKIGWLAEVWQGPLGIHTHDNLGLALMNSMAAVEAGVTWVDSTVTGMGRGPGNARTEEVLLEVAEKFGRPLNIVPLLNSIDSYFGPLKAEHAWGTNPYYFLAGQKGIHPSFIQEMLQDQRYTPEDIINVIEQLDENDRARFDRDKMNVARRIASPTQNGSWKPKEKLENCEVMLLGPGSGAFTHKTALESYIQRKKPIVIAINTSSPIDTDLIDLRIACHPTRMLADSGIYRSFTTPIIMPESLLSEELVRVLDNNDLLDFGLKVSPGQFEFSASGCEIPSPLALGYALAVVNSGSASRVLLAGFDGYPAGDERNSEVEELLSFASQRPGAVELLSVTPSRYKNIAKTSIYGM